MTRDHGTKKGSKKVSNNEFYFTVDPAESDADREARWDEELTKLHAQGLTIEGVGPDGDWPVRVDTDKDATWEDFFSSAASKFTEVYNLVALAPGKWVLDPESGNFAPKSTEVAVRG